jgi:hypothetical protein
MRHLGRIALKFHSLAKFHSLNVDIELWPFCGVPAHGDRKAPSHGALT